ncbi:alpha/beta hydrolase [Massilia arenosa]|uniref:Alpha/beta hydrolase n=1 Tax=Zemynaea arenosa TaxID=2561931 RepID=A0A4Y9SAK0_9BURK|nr:alpha/beta hydrolase [Massilia arenosa]TFW17591.1 alpha/beta hydrolase [Massilia arenosa]
MTARIHSPNLIATEDGVHLFYRDWGHGRPVLFVGGWAMPSDSWGYQTLALSRQGLRCIAFDRRGHGRSSDPGRGYDFDTLAGDIAAVIEALDLRDVTLVGHSMGCNEIVRYLTRFGSGRIARVALLGAMTPGVTVSPNNPSGIDPALLAQFRMQLMRDLPEWIEANIEPFVPGANATTKNWLTNMCMGCSLQALHDCNIAVETSDMVNELRAIDVPVLLIAGDIDVSAPLELTARRSAALIHDVELKVYHGAAHGMFITHVDRVNADLLEFIRAGG